MSWELPFTLPLLRYTTEAIYRVISIHERMLQVTARIMFLRDPHPSDPAHRVCVLSTFPVIVWAPRRRRVKPTVGGVRCHLLAVCRPQHVSG